MVAGWTSTGQAVRPRYLVVALSSLAVLQDRWGHAFAADDDSGSGTNFEIRHRVAPDYYYVRVTAGGSGDTGDYTLVGWRRRGRVAA